MKRIKEKLINKDSYILLKNIVILTIVFLGLFFFTFYTFFVDFKDELIKDSKKAYFLKIENFDNKIKPLILNHDILALNKQLDELLKTNDFQEITIELNQLIFNKNALILNTPNFSDEKANISDVVVDIKYGEIRKIDNYYELIPSSNLDKTQYLNIRYQAFVEDEVKNLFARFDFKNINKKQKTLKNKIEFPFWFSYIFDTTFKPEVKEIYLNKIKIATISYILEPYNIKYEVYTLVKKLFFYAFIMFFPIILIFNYYNRFVFKKYVTKPLHKLNKILDDILENKFHKIKQKDFDGVQEVTALISKISTISNKLASSVNELNISKETIERKMSTDTLTGLENQKIFELDIKGMFVSSISGYVLIVKIPSLVEFTKLNGSSYTDTFIENFVTIIKNIIYRFSKVDITMYRFYGSEFAIIAKRHDSVKIEEICKAIVNTIVKELSSKYKLPENIINIGATPFDLYGTLNSIMNSVNEAYNIAKNNQPNSFYLITEKQIEHNYATLEKIVSTTIHDANFDVDYASNSYTFGDNKLVMQEVSPLLYDNNQQKLPIGSFVSIAEKINEIVNFDKLVITKVIEYLKYSKATHEIAINLAVDTIANKEFNKWLEKILNENENLKRKIVFSITSYTASHHKHKFKKFVKHVKELGAKVLLKRYNTNDYPLEELENLNLDYLRIDKDYTTNVANDKVKKHKVKNILIFAQLNDMEILTEGVKADNDYALLERLGIYATSR
ncbi:hypothetical protein CP985_07880 [Malaciobacter mytili LMG 24559]|uniref:Diguanylate cyclase/phosphodiesterase n=2 Tax=Malaciobacter mytili TaxID=603050 RepID=A0AAX2AF71_9BACT|nr:EAL domain-containing protein [Malaciobacter mytili]AXH15245.1 diguanylate cyclase/phosphodiesterase [Malaciobacter mytili LMG 24559]RXK15563.1 hypothetical protein CP985_07880 [Malaciobacter mytili LMG 24559]